MKMKIELAKMLQNHKSHESKKKKSSYETIGSMEYEKIVPLYPVGALQGAQYMEGNENVYSSLCTSAQTTQRHLE